MVFIQVQNVFHFARLYESMNLSGAWYYGLRDVTEFKGNSNLHHSQIISAIIFRVIFE